MTEIICAKCKKPGKRYSKRNLCIDCGRAETSEHYRNWRKRMDMGWGAPEPCGYDHELSSKYLKARL